MNEAASLAVEAEQQGQKSRAYFIRRLEQLKKEQINWRSHWEEISQLVLPRRGRFNTNAVSSYGSKKNDKIMNGAATYSMRTLVSGMVSGVTSPARPWVRLGTSDPALQKKQDVAIWLEDTRDKMLEVFARSNFYKTIPLIYKELGAFGTAALSVVADKDDVVRFYAYTIGSYYVAQNDREIVDVIYREYQMTLSQAAQKFGVENLSKARQEQLKKNPDEWMVIVHAIEPNHAADKQKMHSRAMPFISVYYESSSTGSVKNKDPSDKEFLRVSGFKEFPVMVPRWSRAAEDIYGCSPVMDALADIKQLQTETKYKHKNVQKMVDPPMRAPVSLEGRRVSQIPGDVTYYNQQTGGVQFEPAIVVDPRGLAELRADISELVGIISKALYEDLFLMLSGSDRREITAREVDEKHEEKLMALSPVLESINDELLDPLIDRVFSLMLDAGIISPPPESIKDQDLKVEYISILAQAQKTINLTGIERYAGFVGSMAQIDPSARHKMDVKNAIDVYGDSIGVSPKIVRSNEDCDAMAAEEAKAAQAAQSMQMMESAARAAKDASSVPDDSNMGKAMQAASGIGQ